MKLDRSLIFDYQMSSIVELLSTWGEPRYRAEQVWTGLYKNLWEQPQEFSSLPKDLRLKLDDYFEFSHLDPETELSSSDGETLKTLFRLPDGQAVEAVLMCYSRRRTLCISTQAGCAMGCVFCATGQMGFQRHLTTGEIVEQVLYYARLLASANEHVTNVVIMGMGEPFHNYDATMQAIDCLNHPKGFNLGARRFTVSTVGLVPAIRRFATEHRQVNLAVSLHAADNQTRDSLLPINRRYPLEQLFAACYDYVRLTNRRITFEWALINGVNDSLSQARSLAKRLESFTHKDRSLCHVNVIPLNPTHLYDQKATSRQQALAFQSELERQGIPCTIRVRRGIDIQAGCGQLAIRMTGSRGEGIL